MNGLLIEEKASNCLRPMMSVAEIVNYLKQKNIKFIKMSEDEAENYLKNNNNYYNVTAYKNNFEKYKIGELQGKYIDLDFAYLKDLSIIDMRLRLVLFKIIIDIEHYLKIQILNKIENIEEEDGYKIVNMYLKKDYTDKKFPRRIHDSIVKKVDNEYYKKIFSKYDINQNQKIENIPIWEFLEIITFGELVNFYDFFTNEYKFIEESKMIFILRDVVRLRNAVAHNSCVLSELDKKDNLYSPDYKVIQFLNDCGIKKKARDKKLKNSRIRQITYTLYLCEQIISSEGVKNNIKEDISNLFYKRISHHEEYYNNNDLLKSTYQYFKKIIDHKYGELV